MGEWSGDYYDWLKSIREADCQHDADLAASSYYDDLSSSPFYQKNAFREGRPFPIVANRKGTRKCSILVEPSRVAHIGDIFDVLGQQWLCVELYQDAYGIQRGTLWLCNHTLHYLSQDAQEHYVPCVLDDGSYSAPTNTAIPVERGQVACYISMNDETNWLHVDKRIALYVKKDARYETDILEVGKVAWIDRHTKNFGDGSHLMMMSFGFDVYNSEYDSVEHELCDYYIFNEKTLSRKSDQASIRVVGKDTIRVGTQRTYALLDGDAQIEDVTWTCNICDSGIQIVQDGGKAIVSIPLCHDIVGTVLTITGTANGQNYSKEVEVVSIG